MSANPYLGEITLLGCDFPPRGWAQCNNQILAIAQNQSLYSLLGTIYGGDGRTSMALPGLRGRAVMGSGNGNPLGRRAGQEDVTLVSSELPSHDHVTQIPVSTTTLDNATSVTNGFLQDYTGLTLTYQSGVSGSAERLAGTSLANTGGTQSHENRQPFQAINYCIALQGVFPSRS